jgi:AcrR family transcriptional regulator
MADRKRPRRTRERILETSLALFNRAGAPNVTTADIADEMNISPGNLYYHFGNKEEIVAELYAAHEARVLPLFADPRGRAIGIEDVWLWLHLLFEEIARHRFLYRDLDLIAARDSRLGARFGKLIRQGGDTVVELCGAMVAAGTMRASPREIAALAQNILLVATYWHSFERLRRATRGEADEPDVGRAAYQVLTLLAPYLVGDARTLIERLGEDYL